MTASTGTILIVEDNEPSLKMAKKLLEMAGYPVIEAVSAEQSIQVAVEQHPDLILMDMHLPGIDGYAASKELKEIPQTADIPIVAFTALAMPEEQKKALDYGCVGVISKPIHVSSFAETVGEYLNGKVDSGFSNVTVEKAEGTTSAVKNSHRTILLTLNSLSLKDLLQDLGHTVILLQDEAEPVQLLQNNAIDLVIVDEPFLAALEPQALSNFKSELTRKGTPALLATAFSNRDVLFKAKDWVSDFITVPFHLLEIETRIQSIIHPNSASKMLQDGLGMSNPEKNLERFLQAASHDLQGPVRKITRFVGFLSEAKQADETENEYYLSGISRNALQIELIIKNLLSSIRNLH